MFDKKHVDFFTPYTRPYNETICIYFVFKNHKKIFLLFFVLFLGVTVQHHRHVNLDIVDRNI